MTEALPYIRFPSLRYADEEGLLCIGGNLSPEVLISAYSQGIFPWYSNHQPIQWWSPDPRCLLYPSAFRPSRSLRRSIFRRGFSFSIDRSFREVIGACGRVIRRGQVGTWITPEIVSAYCELHRLGLAHSVEVWQGERLCGGLYGVSLGSIFFGESMFSLVNDASKAALFVLVGFSQVHRFRVIDCQMATAHLLGLGAVLAPRRQFLDLLNASLRHETLQGSWYWKSASVVCATRPPCPFC